MIANAVSATGTDVRVRVTGPAHDADWDAYVGAHPRGLLYHTAAWRDFIADLFGHRPAYLAAERNGAIAGVLPLFHVRVPLIGSKLISLPYDIGAGGPMADDVGVERTLAEAALSLAKELRVDFLELRGPAAAAPLLPHMSTAEPVMLSEMDLSAGEDAVLGAIAPDHLKSVRKAERRGIRVRATSDPADYDAFYRVYLECFRAFGTPPYARRYFMEVQRRFAADGRARLLVAELDGAVVGGLLMFCLENRWISKFAAVHESAVPLRAYAALYHDAIRLALRERVTRLSWGTSSHDQTGLIDFKERWGSTSSRPLFCRHTLRGEPTDVASYFAESRARRMWRRLPLPLTRVLGPPLNRWYC